MNKQLVLKESVGIDVSKDSISVCLCKLTDAIEKEFVTREDLPNTTKGFVSLKIWIKRVLSLEDHPMIVMEATGVYHQKLAYYFHKQGFDVCILQSGRVKRYAQSLDQRSKTDSLDSKMLSRLGCERSLQAWEPPSIPMLNLRLLSRERSHLIKEKNVELNLLESLQSSHHSLPIIERRYKKRIKLLEKQIEEVEQQMKLISDEDIELSKKLSYLMSIPGISFISAITVVAETFGFSNFESAKQLVSYTGYDVVIRESGKYRGKSKISKKGNRYIRAVLHMPSMTAIRVNPTLRPFYLRLKPKKVKPIVALVAVQRKLLILMYTLWKNNEFYDAEYEKKRQGPESLAAQDNNKKYSVAS